jgi:hypothetical protein
MGEDALDERDFGLCRKRAQEGNVNMNNVPSRTWPDGGCRARVWLAGNYQPNFILGLHAKP